MYLGQAMGICPGLMNFQTFDTSGTPYKVIFGQNTWIFINDSHYWKMFLFCFKIFLLINITYALATGDKQGGTNSTHLYLRF